MSKDIDNDMQFFEEHLQKHPDSILFARLADIYLKKQKVEQAIQICEEGIKKHPYYVTGHLVLGKCYLANKLFDQAEQEFKRVLRFDPKYLSAHKLYGDLMEEIGWENTCEMSYKKILEIDPLDEVARSRVGDHFLRSPTEEEETHGVAPSTDTAEIDFDAIEPMAAIPEVEVEPQEEQEGRDLHVKEVESKAEMEPEPFEIDLPAPPTPDIDEDKADEFSDILDDIFRDEVVKEELEIAPEGEETASSLDEFISDLEQNRESYLDEMEPFQENAAEAETPVAREDAAVNIFSEEPQREVKPEEPEVQKPFVAEPSGADAFTFRPPSVEEKADEDLIEPEPPQKPVREKIVTPTLGEIYAAQGQYAKAIGVFELLVKKHPDNQVYSQKIEILKKKLEESRDAPKD
ncbi:MAG: tetratricopeptide repeat protein [bacterium]